MVRSLPGAAVAAAVLLLLAAPAVATDRPDERGENARRQRFRPLGHESGMEAPTEPGKLLCRFPAQAHRREPVELRCATARSDAVTGVVLSVRRRREEPFLEIEMRPTPDGNWGVVVPAEEMTGIRLQIAFAAFDRRARPVATVGNRQHPFQILLDEASPYWQEKLLVEQLSALNREAIGDFEAGDLASALDLIERAISRADESGLHKHPIHSRSLVHRGIFLLRGRGDTRAAKRDFCLALELTPEIRITRTLSTPEVEQAFRSACR